jgi:hypothetical protein
VVKGNGVDHHQSHDGDETVVKGRVALERTTENDVARCDERQNADEEGQTEAQKRSANLGQHVEERVDFPRDAEDFQEFDGAGEEEKGRHVGHSPFRPHGEIKSCQKKGKRECMHRAYSGQLVLLASPTWLKFPAEVN